MDDALRRRVRELGGISAMAISHPHFYGWMREWAHAFDAPVYIHEADRRWTARPDDAIVYWQGDTREIGDGLTLINAGVHFDGGQVLHWSGGPRACEPRAGGRRAPRAAGCGGGGAGGAGAGGGGRGGGGGGGGGWGGGGRGGRGSGERGAGGQDGAGVLCSGDIMTVAPDRRYVSFMYSYPNLIPERPRTI